MALTLGGRVRRVAEDQAVRGVVIKVYRSVQLDFNRE